MHSALGIVTRRDETCVSKARRAHHWWRTSMARPARGTPFKISTYSILQIAPGGIGQRP